MPYLLVMTQVNLRSACVVGDKHSDPELMKRLDATFCHFYSPKHEE
jgi:hypothetical protein